MPLTMAINAWYRHPGRHQARIRAYVTDKVELIGTHAGPELSAGPVEFGTDFGGWCSRAKPHGGWNVDGHNIWFAFNCRGQGRTAWKILFRHAGGFKFTGTHPYEEGVHVELEFQSVTRWRISVPQSWTLGTWVRAPREIAGFVEANYLGAREGEDLFIVYEGKEATEDVDWVFVLSLEGSSGWMAKDQLRQGDWDKVEEETLTGFTDVMSALDDTRMRRELVGTTRLADTLVAENSQDD